MDDPRDVFLRRVRTEKGFRVNHQSYSAHIRDALMDVMFYTIVDYINTERTKDELGLGRLERAYSFPQAFMDAKDPHAWLDANRSVDDTGLIMYVYDNMYNMTPGKHRRTLLYLVSIVDFDL